MVTAASGVAAPHGGWGTPVCDAQPPPREKKTPCFLHEKNQDGPKVEKGYIKNQVTYQKNGLLYLAGETCDQTQDKGFPDTESLNGSL